jgi:hypothetical protein
MIPRLPRVEQATLAMLIGNESVPWRSSDCHIRSYIWG